MNDLAPFETLYSAARPSAALPLPPLLAALYGRLAFPPHAGRPYVVANFVSSLDGVVTLDAKGETGGGEISGGNPHDRVLMGLLRAVADVVVVGAGTLRAEPQHRWTAEFICPRFADAFADLRRRLGKTKPPLTAIVTASSGLDLSLPVFQSGATEVCVVTTQAVAEGLRRQTLPPSVQVIAATDDERVPAAGILAVVQRLRAADLILTEGGPHLMGDLLAERRLDELFLTLAPQIAGRADPDRRPGFAAGQELAPAHPLWGTLLDLKRAGEHVFLRYAFPTAEKQPDLR